MPRSNADQSPSRGSNNSDNMLKKSNSKAVKGHGFLILNVIRYINIIVLLSLIVSLGALVAFAKMPNGFTIFQDFTLVAEIVLCFVLIYSEIPGLNFLKDALKDTLPMFSDDRGFTWLGAAMFIIGSRVLGSLSDSRFTLHKLGLPVWRLCIGAGILSIIFGIVNFVCSFVFRSGETNARLVRADGAVAQPFKLDGASDYYGSSVQQPQKKGLFAKLFGGKKEKSLKKADISHPTMYDEERNIGIDHKTSSPVVDGQVHPAFRGQGSFGSGNSEVSQPPSTYHMDGRRNTHYTVASGFGSETGNVV